MNKPLGVPLAILAVAGGVAMLVLGAKAFLTSAVAFADAFGISKAVTGLTIVAVGTSLPELATSFVAALKGENDIAIGNIVGSNIFNTLAVVGLAGTISPFQNISPYLLTRDLPVMVLATVLIGVFGFNARAPREPKSVGRVAGGIWLLLFAVYMGLMLWQELK